MRFLAYVVLDVRDGLDIPLEVNRTLEPFKPHYLCDHRIGGRWTGHFDPNYNPTEDPENHTACSCKDRASHCPKCENLGYRIKRPEKWKFHSGDVVKIRDIPKFVPPPTALVIQEGKGELSLPTALWVEDDTYTKKDLETLLKAYKNQHAVIVDCRRD